MLCSESLSKSFASMALESTMKMSIVNPASGKSTCWPRLSSKAKSLKQESFYCNHYFTVIASSRKKFKTICDCFT